MPNRDGTGPRQTGGHRNTGCRRGSGRFRNDPYCRRYTQSENNEDLLKEQASYYKEQLNRVNSQLNGFKDNDPSDVE